MRCRGSETENKSIQSYCNKTRAQFGRNQTYKSGSLFIIRCYGDHAELPNWNLKAPLEGWLLCYGMHASHPANIATARPPISSGNIGKWLSEQETPFSDNRTHYTISQSTVSYDTQLTNHSLTTVIVFRCRNYPDSFFSYVHLFSDIPSNDNAFSIWAEFASNRIGRVYVHSTNMADLIFFHKTITFRMII